MNRLPAIEYPADADIMCSYDIFGNKLTMTDATGTTTYSHDAFKRPTSEVIYVGGHRVVSARHMGKPLRELEV